MTPATTTEVETTNEVVQYSIVPGESTFTVQAFAEGLLSAFAHDPIISIRSFAGEVAFVPETFQQASLMLTIDAKSLAVTGGVKEKDLVEVERAMRDEVLEVNNYSEITFTSTNISASRIGAGRYRTRIIGDVTLHGVTQKNIWISGEATIAGETLRAKGDFSLKQKDFGIKPFAAVGGTIKLKNELKFSFDIAAARKG
ncbi:MAG TPA: YceI family protein [Pyrinomonadaceae bacterium]|nr:YceI family protein [Pyrinomonadaceae bacterium]